MHKRPLDVSKASRVRCLGQETGCHSPHSESECYGIESKATERGNWQMGAGAGAESQWEKGWTAQSHGHLSGQLASLTH